MTIRMFENECWICGWFGKEGQLIDIQQYTTEELARETARDVRKSGLYPFVGKLEEEYE